MPTSAPSHCPVCGAVVPDDAPDGTCTRCLMQAAMQPTGPEDHARPEPPSLEAVSAAFPQLEILELIGHGGMGAVYKARQPKLDRLVALKLLPASLVQKDPAFEGRFEREGRLLARLHHPNIVAVHDSGSTGGFFYLLMEFVEGVNLRQAMRSKRFTAAQALGIVPHICDAMQFAHDEGVLHRDIKPENILLDRKGRVKLADFGIAKLMGEHAEAQASGESGSAAPARSDFTQSGATLGTPSYMAPEQRETPGAVDHRADIYSLGVVFYELLTGELPTGSFVPPSSKSEADPSVDAIVAQALEKERTRRQNSAGEMKTQVETVVQKNGAPRPGRSVAGKFALGCLGVASFAVLAVGGLWLMAEARARQAELQAVLEEERMRAAQTTPVEAALPGPVTAQVQELQREYEEALSELLDVRMERELDVLRPEPEREGEALAQKEKTLTDKAIRLGRALKAALPSDTPAFNEEIGTRR